MKFLGSKILASAELKEYFKYYLNLINFFINEFIQLNYLLVFCLYWLRGLDLNQGPSGYEPDELPDCSTPRLK